MRKDMTLRDIPLFAGCRTDQIRFVQRLGTVLDLESGREICREGATAREFVVVLEGDVVATNGAGPVVCGPGSHFGETGLLDGGTHEQGVVTLGPARVLVFDGRAFRGMLERVPSVSRKILRELAGRVRSYSASAPRSLRVVS